MQLQTILISSTALLLLLAAAAEEEPARAVAQPIKAFEDILVSVGLYDSEDDEEGSKDDSEDEDSKDDRSSDDEGEGKSKFKGICRDPDNALDKEICDDLCNNICGDSINVLCCKCLGCPAGPGDEMDTNRSFIRGGVGFLCLRDFSSHDLAEIYFFHGDLDKRRKRLTGEECWIPKYE